MTTHLRSVAATLALIAAILLGTVMLEQFALHLGVAHAQAAAGSGSAALPSAVPNPTEHPIEYLSTLAAFKTYGWPVTILIGVLGLLELAAYLGKNVGFLAWFGKGRISVVIAGLTTICISMVAAIAGGGTWGAVLISAIPTAWTLFLHPAGTDPAKA